VVTRAAPHYLVAEGEPLDVRRSRGGDAWQARQDAPAVAATGPVPAAPAVLLGMPALGRPQ
jgi:tRNA-2-methylthio-N6-dimethylallyladenosine synthase